MSKNTGSKEEENSIPFNKPFLVGRELEFIKSAVESGKISGDGIFTKKCQDFFEKRYGFRRTLMTTSCTDALEMAAILINTSPGDEIIIPSYTFVSTANAFVLRGAKIIFADSRKQNPNIDVFSIEDLITEKTKAIVPVHYAGVACDMEEIMNIAQKYNLWVIEDAAQAVDSFYNGRPLGGVGQLSTFSFHETKNVISGEGGMLVINDERLLERAEIIREKGTNRSKFFRGEVDKYGWVDIGSSFLPSEIISAFLFAQLDSLQKIQTKRIRLWEKYYERLEQLTNEFGVKLPFIDEFATNNGHMFYLICNSFSERSRLLRYLRNKKIHAVFHYMPLHDSQFYKTKHDGRKLSNCDRYSDCLIRLPLYYDLSEQDVEKISAEIINFYRISKANLS